MVEKDREVRVKEARETVVRAQGAGVDRVRGRVVERKGEVWAESVVRRHVGAYESVLE